MRHFNYTKHKLCADCGKEISNRATKCNRCNRLGDKASAEERKNLSIAHKGQIPWIKGKRGINAGEKHYNWKGGLAWGGYGREFTKDLKEQVRFRDSYKCQMCGCPQVENHRALPVHHIDYNKKNNELNNLISLCESCHTKTVSKREYWINYFKEKIKCNSVH